MRLIDGARCVDMPLCYFKKNNMKAGEYLIFYRSAFRHDPSASIKSSGTSKFVGSPGSRKSGKGDIDAGSIEADDLVGEE